MYSNNTHTSTLVAKILEIIDLGYQYRGKAHWAVSRACDHMVHAKSIQSLFPVSVSSQTRSLSAKEESIWIPSNFTFETPEGKIEDEKRFW